MAIANTIPGFSGLSSNASELIKSLMSGQLSTGSRKAIYDAGAERGAASGMPGSTGLAGSLFANADLRNIGRTAEDQQQRGFQDLLAMIAGYSGTVTPTTGQEIQQEQFGQQLGFQKEQADLANSMREREYYQRYGPKRRSFGTFKNGRFSTDLSVPGSFGATSGAKGFDYMIDAQGRMS